MERSFLVALWFTLFSNLRLPVQAPGPRTAHSGLKPPTSIDNPDNFLHVCPQALSQLQLTGTTGVSSLLYLVETPSFPVFTLDFAIVIFQCIDMTFGYSNIFVLN